MRSERVGRSLVIGEPHAPWLVLCHGMALDHRDLIPLARAAAERNWRVLLWDMPGHGGSPPPAVWSIEAMADALEAILDAHAVTRCALLGFSFGGVVAQELVRRRPAAVEALIAYACFAPRVTGPLGPRWLVSLMFGWRSWAAIKQDFARRCAITTSGRAQILAALSSFDKPRFLAMSRALLSGVPADMAYRVECPLFLLAGAEDANGASLRKAQNALAARARTVERVIVANAGHCAHIDAPDATASAILAFLGRVRQLVDQDLVAMDGVPREGGCPPPGGSGQGHGRPCSR